MEIFLRNIEKNFNGISVLSDLSFSVKDGEILILSGENGSGKTTLLRIISFLTIPTDGEISYKIGFKNFIYNFPYRHVKEVSSRISFLHQKNIILKGNIEYNLKLGKMLRGENSFDTNFYNLIERFGVSDIFKNDIYKVSEGQRRIVCFLRCVSVKWDILLLDEPFANLDSNYVEKITSYLNEQKQKGKLIIVATPDTRILNGLYFDKIIKLEKKCKN
jgi:ABC-type multidrug transport system ATPase subunit